MPNQAYRGSVRAGKRLRPAVVDACSCNATDRDEAVAFFSRSTRNLLEAERQAGVQHHVLLSIAGLTRITGNAHYAGDVLLPGPDARIAPTTFEDWLAGETRT